MTKQNDTAIKVSHVSKSFKLPHESQSSLKGRLINFRKRGYETQHVLKSIDFEIKKGEFFGIVGRNGSGKSTLLKILAGIYTPNQGNIQINGKLTPFIELGVGFNPELSGRDNVYLNGALLGFTRKEMDDMYDDIVQFAELARFMDQKLKNYSSGMQVRLAFSIAIRANTDILVLDEVLAVGDAAFQQKCFDYFTNLKKNKKTVVLVTHDMSAVRQYCDRAVMIEKGEIVAIGKPSSVASEYQKLFINEKNQTEGVVGDNRWGEGGLTAKSVKVSTAKETVSIKTTYVATEDIENPIFGFTIYGPTGINVLESNTQRLGKNINSVPKGQKIDLDWVIPNIFSNGVYSVSVACCNQSMTKFFEWFDDAATFRINTKQASAGAVSPDVTVGIERKITR